MKEEDRILELKTRSPLFIRRSRFFLEDGDQMREMSDRTSKLNPRSPFPSLDWAIVFFGGAIAFCLIGAILGGEERSPTL